MTIGGYAVEILEPEENYRNGRAIIYCHGSGETEDDPRVSLGKPPTVAMLTQAGYIIAGSAGGGPTNWGSPTAVAAYEALHDHVVATYDPDKVLWWADSMGGMSSLNTILVGDVQCDGWYGIEPAVNLGAIHATGFQPWVNEAYECDNGTYAAVTVGYDPCLRAAADFDGMKMRFVASASDTAVSKTNNTDTLRTLVSGHATESGLVTATGDHGDLSHYLPTDVLSFFNRC